MSNSTGPRNHSPEYLLLWCAVFLLVGIGIAATINRAVAVRKGALLFDPFRERFPAAVVQDLEKYDREFVIHPLLTFLHIVPASIFLILAPLQFSSRIRDRHIEFHRWSGRLIVLIGFLAVSIGLLLGVPFRFTGAVASSAVMVYGVLFLISLIQAFTSIRRHDVASHREWMIRVFSIGIGISTVRIVSGVLVLMVDNPSFDLLGLSFWIGWTLTFAAGELWIRGSRRSYKVQEAVSV